MAERTSELDKEIRRLINAAGPMPVSEFMGLCLGHPRHGYYMSHDPFGGGGDFVTAPEVSQMFGELIGLWTAAVWRQMGSPPELRLIELGPGRGTMMTDALRATKVVPDLRQAASVHLVEMSPLLRERQETTLIGCGFPVSWHDSLAAVPPGPTILLANEFFDALPVSQVVKLGDGWHERRIGVGDDDQLIFTLASDPIPYFDRTLPAAVRSAADGAIFEWRSDRTVFEICRRLKAAEGAALVIDYGHVASAVGDTFQAVRWHRFADPLATPGEVDITAHVDFEALAAAAECTGMRVHGPVTQNDFLMRLGIEKRAATLKRAAPEKAADIDAALQRLTDRGARGMGTLFKVIGLSTPQLAGLPGLERSNGLQPGGMP